MILQMADPVKELKEIRFTSEKEMQHFCEKNMEQMLGLQFIASEFRVAQFRFDSVAYNPVSTAFNIIEYKNDKNFSVVDQGYSYISTLLQHKADFVLRYNQIWRTLTGHRCESYLLHQVTRYISLIQLISMTCQCNFGE